MKHHPAQPAPTASQPQKPAARGRWPFPTYPQYQTIKNIFPLVHILLPTGSRIFSNLQKPPYFIIYFSLDFCLIFVYNINISTKSGSRRAKTPRRITGSAQSRSGTAERQDNDKKGFWAYSPCYTHNTRRNPEQQGRPPGRKSGYWFLCLPPWPHEPAFWRWQIRGGLFRIC